jgi:pSer/pThr/pTyr-binding forkhead associated (FHA) protein
MEIFEKINRAFGGWYEGLFGGSDDVRPRDILRRILTAMEEHRKEGIDGKVYVPNQYILEIAVDDEEEKEYLLSFLDREELEAAIRRYCQQNHYNVRGGLDFTIKEVETTTEGKKREKVRVRCRYDSKLAAEKPSIPPEIIAAEVPAATEPDALATVYDDFGSSELGTVPGMAIARLAVCVPGKPSFEIPINKSAFSIGRSSRAGNDLVLDHDGLVSRRHAKIELESDGKFTIYDLETTNGTRVNGKKIDNKALVPGDEIVIGATQIRFTHEQGENDGIAQAPSQSAMRQPQIGESSKPRLILSSREHETETYILASETIVGRGSTNDIVVPEKSVATRHVRIIRGKPFTLEALDREVTTLLNGSPLAFGTVSPLIPGDRIGIGPVTMRFEADEP